MEWRNIPGYPGYQAREDGVIMSPNRQSITPTLSNKTGGNRRNQHPESVVQYLRVGIYNAEGKRENVQVHTLVLLAFKGCRPTPQHQARHLDGDRFNNHHTNLVWGTRSENEQDKLVSGTALLGEKNHNARLTADMVREIRESTVPATTLCQTYPVSASMISRIRRGKSWTHVD